MSDPIPLSRQTDLMDPARANALLSSLGRAGLDAGDPVLPPFFHHLYFWDAQPPDTLGRDGHPRVGTGLVPDTGLPRRMWAGGRLRFDAPLRAGHPAEKRSRVASVTRKTGRSGPLAFVTVEHEIWQDNRLCVREAQDLVYREDASPEAKQPVRPTTSETAQDTRTVGFDTTLLFRYSALTFNGHRIHYDEHYARHTEGYDGLVVHGPLLAQLLMLWAEETSPHLTGFSFAARYPVAHQDVVHLCRDGVQYWVKGRDSTLHMVAKATY